MANLLLNPGFSDATSTHQVLRCYAGGHEMTERGEIASPAGWLAYFYHDPGTWDQPEVRGAEAGPPVARYVSPPRGWKLFGFFRSVKCGLMQRLKVSPGDRLRLTAQAHAWSNHLARDDRENFPHPDDPSWSEGVGRGPFFCLLKDAPPLSGNPKTDAVRNAAFKLGIDPTGGQDPFAPTVVWGEAACIYNVYHEVPAVEVEAQGDHVTVFLHGRMRWPFKHNDMYWDNAALEVLGSPTPPTPPTPLPPSPPGPPAPPGGLLCVPQGGKLAIHGIRPANIGSYVEQAAAAGAPLAAVKMVDDLTPLIHVKAVSPSTLTVARLVHSAEGCPRVQFPDTNLDRLARDIMAPIFRKLDAQPALREAVDVWEAVNEPDPPGVYGYQRLSELMIKCMDLGEAEGLRLCLFGLNAGTPEWDEMVGMAESGVFQRARQGGHVLTLHEGVTNPNAPIDSWFGDLIPGSPRVDGAGAQCFRYRYLVRALEEAGAPMIPVIVSEWYGGHAPLTAQQVTERARWYDEEAAKDPWILAFCPFTLGPVGAWKSHDYDYAYPSLVAYTISVKDRQNATHEPQPTPPSPPSGRGQPREQYERVTVLLPPTADAATVNLVSEATWGPLGDYRFSIGASADDAGIGDLDKRIVLAVNPSEWGDDLGAFFETHYPGVAYLPIESENGYQLRGRLLAHGLRLRDGISLAYPVVSSKHGKIVTDPFGVYRPKDGIYHGGIDLKGSWAAWQDLVVAALGGRVTQARDSGHPFGWQVVTETVLLDGRKLELRYAHLVANSLTVKVGDQVAPGQQLGKPDNTGSSTGDHLHFSVCVRKGSAHCYVDPAVLLDWGDETPAPPPPPPAPSGEVRIGFNGIGGAEWMKSQGLRGFCVEPIFLAEGNGVAPKPVDYTHLAAAGIDVMGRLCYSWATDPDQGGLGTIAPQHLLADWEAAAVQTILNSKGIRRWAIFNEYNNRREWAKGETLTPRQVADSYNRIVAQLPRELHGQPLLVAPGAVDPFFGPSSDCMDWWCEILDRATRVDFLDLHGYVRGPDPALVGSTAMFSDPPLDWQYLNFPLCCLTLIAAAGTRLPSCPAYVSEFNHLWRTVEPDWGWVSDQRAGDVITAAMEAARSLNADGLPFPIRGLAVYRWDFDHWKVRDNPHVLEAVRREAERG